MNAFAKTWLWSSLTIAVAGPVTVVVVPYTVNLMNSHPLFGELLGWFSASALLGACFAGMIEGGAMNDTPDDGGPYRPDER